VDLGSPSGYCGIPRPPCFKNLQHKELSSVTIYIAPIFNQRYRNRPGLRPFFAVVYERIDTSYILSFYGKSTLNHLWIMFYNFNLINLYVNKINKKQFYKKKFFKKPIRINLFTGNIKFKRIFF